jgi:hypothetical protein
MKIAFFSDDFYPILKSIQVLSHTDFQLIAEAITIHKIDNQYFMIYLKDVSGWVF